MGGGFGYECYIDINCASIDFGLRASIFSLSSASKGSISAAGPLSQGVFLYFFYSHHKTVDSAIETASDSGKTLCCAGALPREADEDEDGLPGNVDPAAAPVLTSTVKRRSLGATVTIRTPSFGGRNGAFKDECGSVVTIEVS